MNYAMILLVDSWGWKIPEFQLLLMKFQVQLLFFILLPHRYPVCMI